MKMRKKVIASLLAAVMATSLLASCSQGTAEKKTDDQKTGQEKAGDTKADASGAMVFATDDFNAKFSPFFADTVPDQTISDLVSVGLLIMDRSGAIVQKGIEGEKREYNGKEYTYNGISDLTITENSDGSVYYDFTMKDGLKFSDGEPLTVDDVIFSMYVLADPTYDGNASFFSLPIQGMKEYRSGVDTLFNLLVAAGEENTDFSK